MSYVTDIILITSIEDGGISEEDPNPNVDILNEFIVKEYNHQCAFKKIDGFAGGDKCIQADIFATAINYCRVQELIDRVRSIEWEDPDSVQLNIKDEHWNSFRMFTITGNEQFED